MDTLHDDVPDWGINMGGGGGVSETADQIQEQANNVKLYNYQQQYYQPYIQKFIKQQTGDAASTSQADNVKGQVNAEVMKGVSAAESNPRQINPAAIAKQGVTAANMETTGQVTAAGKVKQRQLGNIQNIVDIGRGQQTNTQKTQEQIAGESVQSAIKNQEADLKMQGAAQDAVGSATGVAAGVANKYMKGSIPNVYDDGGDMSGINPELTGGSQRYLPPRSDYT
jgi:hypothetical protein